MFWLSLPSALFVLTLGRSTWGLPVRGNPSGVTRLGFGSWRVSHITRPDTASGIVSVDGKSRRGGAMACAGKLGLFHQPSLLRKNFVVLRERAAEVRARKFEFPSLGS
jgi:hypothetical protein